jgi:hypothetical protein
MLRLLKDGRYQTDIRAADGHRVQKTWPTGTSKKEAKKLENKLRMELSGAAAAAAAVASAPHWDYTIAARVKVVVASFMQPTVEYCF